jgi:hypothetical protein
MRDLERAIWEWRERRESGSALPTDALDELEAHVRDSAGDLVEAGLTGDEAVLVAERRLGDPRALENEFAKISGGATDRRLRWLLAGVIAALVIPLVADASWSAVVLLGHFAGVPSAALTMAAPVVEISVVLAAAFLLWRLPAGEGAVARFVDGRTEGAWRRRGLAALACGLVVVAFAGKLALTISAVQVFGPSEMGRFALALRYVAVLGSISLPIVVIVLLARRGLPRFSR